MAKLAAKTALVEMKIVAMPKSWKSAAGLAKNKKKSLEAYGEKIRKEWDR